MSTHRRLIWLNTVFCATGTLLQAQYAGAAHSGSVGTHSSGVGRSAISPFHAPASVGLSSPSIGLSPPSIGLSGPTISNRSAGQYPSFSGSPATRNGSINGPWRRDSRYGRYAYALPFAYFGAPYYFSGDNEAVPPEAFNSPAGDNGLGDQVQQLSEKIDQLQSQLSQQGPGAAATAPTEQTPPTPPITVVLKDGRTLEVQNYAVVGNVFWDFSNQPTRKIPLSSINLAASVKASETNGAEFPQLTTSR